MVLHVEEPHLLDMCKMINEANKADYSHLMMAVGQSFRGCRALNEFGVDMEERERGRLTSQINPTSDHNI